MPKLHENRIAAVVIATAMLACACGKSPDPRPRSGSARDTAHISATASGSVILKMTGLLMVVPNHNGKTHVIFPTPSPNGHVAVMGFVMPADSAFAQTLCMHGEFADSARTAHICYVDLAAWSVAPLGEGGPPTNTTDVDARGAINLTQLTGGHFVNVNGGRRDIVLATGEAGVPCSLATWHIKPVVSGAQERHVDLTNVLTWNMALPQGGVFKLSFRSNGSPIPVNLRPNANGNIGIIIAHIPGEDLWQLPPWNVKTQADTPDSATIHAHFDALYDLLDQPTPVQQRTYPDQPIPNGSSCDVPEVAKLIPQLQMHSLGTYACIVVSGGGA